MRYTLCALWGAVVASLWWVLAHFELSHENHNGIMALAVIGSALTVIGMLVLAFEEWNEE